MVGVGPLLGAGISLPFGCTDVDDAGFFHTFRFTQHRVQAAYVVAVYRTYVCKAEQLEQVFGHEDALE